MKIIDTAKEHDSEIIFIVSPALYIDPHHKDLTVFLIQNHLTYIDMSEVITDPKYYYDHDHLNVYGVKKFLQVLKAELAEKNIAY